ncbi:MAG: acetamidase [Acidobacteria bacterium]|nr:acetamidase [Acidobacteriota bacterium]
MKSLASLALLLGLVLPADVGAETHRFVPRTFPTAFAAVHEAALRIKSGDRVVTSTLDDQGTDAEGRTLATGPNPQTGPFYIEGAAPGDLLVVTIESLTPNRATGYSTSLVGPIAVGGKGLEGRPDPTRVPWTIDVAKGTVRLDLSAMAPNVEWHTRFVSPAFEMPLRPVLGSMGVAPAGEASVEATGSGAFGGNMMSGALTAGSRVMLPVSQPGALLMLGHGHARQGDGQIAGTGVETSLDVTFSVEVVKKQEWPHSSVVRPSTVVGEFLQGWPRVENADYLVTVGTAPSLPEALQHATMELHHWLDDDFGLSEKTVSVFVGQAIEYEVSSLAEGHVTVAARVRKSYLPVPVASQATAP